MARTIIGLNDAKAVKKYSALLAVDTAKKGYWSKRFMGKGTTPGTPVQMLTELENDAGEQITYDLNLQMTMRPVYGDDVLEGQEDALKFYTDQIYIDQVRGGVNTGGRMTRKRTLHDLRDLARRRQGDWWARLFDEYLFMYAAGARGVNAGFIESTAFTGFANNAFAAPDADHIFYGGDATSKASLEEADKMAVTLINKLVAHAQMLGGGTEEKPQIMPVMIDGEEHYVLVMTPWDEYNLRAETGAAGWTEIQKAAAAAEGRKNPIFKGGLGMINNVVLHSHKSVIRFNDYGAGFNIAASRSLFMGEQALVVAFGSPGTGLRFDWNEETRDNKNQAVITSSSIFGVKKCRFNGTDFGMIAVDCAAKAP
ncbi:MAG: N4-gp56 family major capsid protein [Gammaproteobacteria bacterium]|nr:N4-gp56 family major capsid protein [Gammaproteobacteria bacterium]